jgi:cytochrome oxidase Cu insertion factor (SCO1/SenC/PrrC family)
LIALIAATVAAVALTGYLVTRIGAGPQAASEARSPGMRAGIPSSLADLMGLSAVPVKTAPNFTLTDQAGHTMSLASFRGRAVVLEFMDPHCTDICPIVSRQFIHAYRELGGRASQVVFAGINVNRYHRRVADVAAYSRAQQLATVPTWHFFTGSYAQLQSVWRAYGVAVHAPSRNADVVHSSLLYFIDPQGRQRFLASPVVDHQANGAPYLPADKLAAWGHGIALVARQLAS